MFKFLRQYNKWILVVFGGLLMVVFLVPTTIQEFSRQSATLGGTWAHHGGSKVSEGERVRLAGQLQTLDTLERGGGMPILTQLRVLTGLDPRNPEHWFLLVREAEAAGFIGGPEEGRAWIQDQILMSDGSITEAEILGRLAGNSRQTPTQVLEALANARGVVRLLNMAALLPISDARARLAALETQTNASADVVVIDASKPLPNDDPAPPTREAMVAHFEKYRDVAPGIGELGFGYLVPNRVRLEWFRIPAESVQLSLEGDPRLSELEVRKTYLRDPGAFFPPGIGGGFPNFDDVAGEVRVKVTDRVARERMSEIERFVEDQFAMALRGANRRGGYFDLTADLRAAQPSFDSIVKAVSEQFQIPVPEYTASEEWIRPMDAATLPRIGAATTTRFGPRARRLGELLEVLREFGGSPTIVVQEGVAGPPLTMPSLTGAVGDSFFFRVVEASPAHAPASLEEVEDAVRNDLLRLARFERLKSEIPEIEKLAVTEGLNAVADRFGTSVQFMPRISEGSPVNIPGLGQDPQAIKAIMERAVQLPKTTPVADVPDADRTFVVSAPTKLALLAVRLTSLRPLSAEDFEQLASMGLLRRNIASRVPNAPLVELYGLEPLKSRHDFRLARQETDNEPGTASR
ncbi:MAG: hypothetical protein KF724_10290 [Phycisphaeraceae bacterium]|nr:hypothetical protein [Phycisphaeraceae bacterium]